MDENEIKSGYVYHIKELYYDKVKDAKLMRTHEGASVRPTYFCLQDKKTGLLWVVPMSGKVEKYQVIIDRDNKCHGKCVKIIIGTYAGKPNAFLFQNMFPLLPKYFDHVHKINNNAVPVIQRLRLILNKNFREVMFLHKKGAKIVFPDINRLEALIMQELDAPGPTD